MKDDSSLLFHLHFILYVLVSSVCAILWTYSSYVAADQLNKIQASLIMTLYSLCLCGMIHYWLTCADQNVQLTIYIFAGEALYTSVRKGIFSFRFVSTKWRLEHQKKYLALFNIF